MKKVIGLFSLLCMLSFFSCSLTQNNLVSPDGKISVELQTDSSRVLRYTVKNGDQTVLEPSILGLKRNDMDFSNLEIVSISDKKEVSGSYITPAEKKLNNTYKANEYNVRVKNSKGKEMIITFHLADNGVAFRYVFDENSEDEKTIEKEFVEFYVPDMHCENCQKKIERNSTQTEGSAPVDVNEIQPGMQVSHDKFGLGKVLNIEGDGDNRRATVFFEGFGQKQLILRFAKLKIVKVI